MNKASFKLIIAPPKFSTMLSLTKPFGKLLVSGIQFIGMQCTSFFTYATMMRRPRSLHVIKRYFTADGPWDRLLPPASTIGGSIAPLDLASK